MARNAPFSLRVGELVTKTLSAYFRNLAPFTVLGVLVFAPWIACEFLFPEGSHRPSRIEYAVWRTLGMFLLQSLLSYVLIGAVTFGVVQQMRGEPPSFGTSITMGLRSFFGAIGTGMLCGLRILLGLILIVPGIIESIRLYVAIPIAIIEGTGGTRAVQRSIDLTAGSRWPIFGTVVLMRAVTIGLGALGGFVIGTTIGFSAHALVWLEVAITVLTSTFSATLGAVCYALLRHGKENVDAKELAAVFA